MNKENLKKEKQRLHCQARKMAERVHPIYESQNWTWGRVEEEHIPSIEEIEQVIHGLIIDMDGKMACISTGGLSIEIDEDGDMRVCFDMQLDEPEEKS